MTLNAEQEKAAHYSGKKPLLVKAGPGAGKTRVIIERVKFLYSELEVDPASIVVITFSRKAAEELIDRLAKEKIPNEDIALMNISTIHSFCFSLLSLDHSLLEIISDDNEERLNLFIRKHLDELGFNGTATLQSKREIESVLKKFSEFTSFKVDIDGLITFIEKNNPVSDEFKALVEENEEFPREEAKKNYNNDWYNARYLQIAKAYPIFLELLEDTGYIDFDSIQRRALEYLENNPETHYKHILVDEFQDTDAVQLRIFQKMIEHCETFTAVGDVDQRIYGFRGATEDCFENMKNKYACESINLDINYRSSNEVIDLSENYISYQRNGYSEKVTGDRKISKPSFYMESKDSEEEAERIAEMISYLKDSGKVKNYGDIAILTRSVSSHAPDITERLQEKNIPYHVTGLNDFIDSDEIKSVIATLYAIIPPSDSPHIMSGWEKEWLNLKAFSSENFKYLIHDFSEESKEILTRLQDKFEEDALSCEKEVHKELTGKTSRKKKFSGIFKRDEKILIEVFKRVQRPDLLQVKLNNKDDQEFLEFLKHYREMFFDEHSLKSLSILELFYTILNRGGFLEHDYLIDPKNRNIIKDLAQLSQTIYNYEEMMGMRNLRGLYWFLNSKLNSYSKHIEPDEDVVSIMTIHKSKGLEFPIVIIPSLRSKKFPTPYKNPLDRYAGGKPTFYTPDEYLEFKENRTPEQKEKIHDEEEDRIIYVAMTRAKDTLIMSSVKEIPKKTRALISNKNINPLTNYKQLEEVESDKEEEAEKIHKMDYTRLRDYQDCPFKYYFLHELNFKVDETKDMKKGIRVHKIFQHINREILKHKDITDEKIDEIIDEVLRKDRNNLKEEIYENIESFYDIFGKDIKVIDTEFPFTINLGHVTIRGIIDLIFEKDGKLGILDYKTTTYKKNRMESYKQQLHLYMYGLSLNPKFKDRPVEKLHVYFVTSEDLVDVEIDEEVMNDVINKIEYISEDIDSGEFEKTTNEEKCENCSVEKNCRECENS